MMRLWMFKLDTYIFAQYTTEFLRPSGLWCVVGARQHGYHAACHLDISADVPLASLVPIGPV